MPRATDRLRDEARFYQVDGRRLPSVTTILSVIAKPALGPWYAREERRAFETAMLEVASRYRVLTSEQLLDAVIQAVDGVKAADREKMKAATIGTAVHAAIEWETRTRLGEDAGPRPRLPEAAEWAVEAWKDWAKRVDFRPLAVERTVSCAGCGYAGTLNWVGLVNGVATLGDYKCLLPDQLLRRADGSTIRADEVMPGDELTSFDGTHFRPDVVKGVCPGGVQPAVEVVSRYGRRLRASANHPVLVGRTWIPASALRRGMPLTICAVWPDSTSAITEAEARLLGYLVGDGSLAYGHRAFAAADPDIAAAVEGLCRELGFTWTLESRPGQTPVYRIGGIGSFLRTHGVFNRTSAQMRVPAAVLHGPPAAAQAFLNGYFDADGYVAKLAIARPDCIFTTISWRLTAEVQDLLWRFGVPATVWRQDNHGYYRQAGARPYWIKVSSRTGSVRLLELLDGLASAKKRDRREAWLRTLGVDDYPPPRANLGQDTVQRIEPLPAQPTIAIEMSETGTFVTSGIVTHNTGKAIYPEAFLQNVAYRHAAAGLGLPSIQAASCDSPRPSPTRPSRCSGCRRR
jgi:hypothetical protein